MTLTERYLKAVAAHLPAAGREDVIAELRDALMTRMEAREAELGRPLDAAEEEAVLREMGHPLAVAARFGAGPQHAVGPEVYPWWLFGVKAGLTVLAVITAAAALARVIIGDVQAGQGLGQAIESFISGGLGIIGALTILAFIVERMKDKPTFLTHWRVSDLAMFEMRLFSLDWTQAGGAAPSAQRGAVSGQMSPTGRAVASATGWGVFLLWWTGLVGGEFRPEALGGGLVAGGVDYGLLVSQTAAWLYWPLLIFAAGRVVFHLIRAATGSPVRFTAAGDVIFGVASACFIGWFWLYSPLAPVFAVDTAAAFFERVRAMIETGVLMVPTIVMLTTALAFLGELSTIVSAAWRLVTGVDRRQ